MGAIRVDVSCWYGYSAGASHYYVRITDEHYNTLCRMRLDTYEEAKAYVDEMLKQYPPDEYRYESIGETKIQFVYDRVGD